MTNTTLPAKLSTRRVIWTCSCGRTVAFDYTATRRFQFVDKYGVAKYGPAALTRVHDDGASRDVSWDRVCPCGRTRKANEVNGQRSEHKCDARCLGSKSGKCECSCGGANHGASYL